MVGIVGAGVRGEAADRVEHVAAGEGAAAAEAVEEHADSGGPPNGTSHRQSGTSSPAAVGGSSGNTGTSSSPRAAISDSRTIWSGSGSTVPSLNSSQSACVRRAAAVNAAPTAPDVASTVTSNRRPVLLGERRDDRLERRLVGGRSGHAHADPDRRLGSRVIAAAGPQGGRMGGQLTVPAHVRGLVGARVDAGARRRRCLVEHGR